MVPLSFPLLVLRFIATIDTDGVDGVEFPEQVSRSSEEGEGIADIVMEDRDEFILVLVLIMDPVIDLLIKEPMPPLRLSNSTLFGRTNFPRFGPQVKYRIPFTEPSFFPTGASNSTPIHTPLAKSIVPIKAIVPE